MKTMIKIYKKYMPKALKKAIVYEQPAVLTAGVKALLVFAGDELQKLVKFVTKKNITDHIAAENLPSFMGGTGSESYINVLKDARSLTVVAEELGISKKDVDKVLKHMEELDKYK